MPIRACRLERHGPFFNRQGIQTSDRRDDRVERREYCTSDLMALSEALLGARLPSGAPKFDRLASGSFAMSFVVQPTFSIQALSRARAKQFSWSHLGGDEAVNVQSVGKHENAGHRDVTQNV